MNVLKRKLPLGAVAFTLVLALAAIGLVYGNWSQTLTIGGTVTTGRVSAEWEFPTNPVTGLPIEQCSDDEVKPFASARQDPQGKTLNIIVEDAYPNYAFDCEWHIRYTGQTPGVVESITFEEKGLTNCRYPDLFAPDGTPVLNPNPDTGGFQVDCDELIVVWVNSQCTLMQNGDLLGGSLIVGVNKDANGVGPAMKTTYGFNIDVEVVQWDKTTCT